MRELVVVACFAFGLGTLYGVIVLFLFANRVIFRGNGFVNFMRGFHNAEPELVELVALEHCPNCREIRREFERGFSDVAK